MVAEADFALFMDEEAGADLAFMFSWTGGLEPLLVIPEEGAAEQRYVTVQTLLSGVQNPNFIRKYTLLFGVQKHLCTHIDAWVRSFGIVFWG